MRKMLPLLALLAAAMTAQAMDAGFDSYVDFRLVAPGNERSWLDGGLGKLRYDTGDSNFQLAGAVGQGYVLFTPEILAVAVIRFDPEGKNSFQPLESYVRYRPVSTTAWRWSAKVGAFFAPFSLENTELGWSSYWTITPSAINSWFGNELRTIGAESTVEWRRADGTLSLTAALFGLNDPAGVLIADRGWSLDDHPTALFEHPHRPDATLILFGAKHPDDTPIFEAIGRRVGWYAGASWDDADQWHAELIRYDNEENPSAHNEDYFAWRTDFWDVGLSKKWDEFTVLSQALTGETIIAPFPGFTSTTRFDSAYALLGWERGEWRLAARGDVFRTHTQPASPFSENGYAMTASASWLPKDWLRVTGEALYIDSTRNERMVVGLAPHQSETQAQLSLRFYL